MLLIMCTMSSQISLYSWKLPRPVVMEYWDRTFYTPTRRRRCPGVLAILSHSRPSMQKTLGRLISSHKSRNSVKAIIDPIKFFAFSKHASQEGGIGRTFVPDALHFRGWRRRLCPTKVSRLITLTRPHFTSRCTLHTLNFLFVCQH